MNSMKLAQITLEIWPPDSWTRFHLVLCLYLDYQQVCPSHSQKLLRIPAKDSRMTSQEAFKWLSSWGFPEA
jgi:hypothetical protein